MKKIENSKHLISILHLQEPTFYAQTLFTLRKEYHTIAYSTSKKEAFKIELAVIMRVCSPTEQKAISARASQQSSTLLLK